jgi:hypothetical protein
MCLHGSLKLSVDDALVSVLCSWWLIHVVLLNITGSHSRSPEPGQEEEVDGSTGMKPSVPRVHIRWRQKVDLRHSPQR